MSQKVIKQAAAGHIVREVILHTTATPGSWHVGKTVAQMRDIVRGWHVKDNGWRDIGYHRIIAPDGSMAAGRSIYEVGAHTVGRNQGTIGICLVPVRTHAGIKTFEDYFTPQQRQALRAYIAELRKLTPIERVTGHNEFAAKECPGFRVKTTDWL